MFGSGIDPQDLSVIAFSVKGDFVARGKFFLPDDKCGRSDTAFVDAALAVAKGIVLSLYFAVADFFIKCYKSEGM